MAYYASTNIAEAEGLITVNGPETSVNAYARTDEPGIIFERWDLVCDYCGRKLFSTTSNSFHTDLTQYYSEAHPGPFHLLAVYRVSGGVDSVTVHVLPLVFTPTPDSDNQPGLPKSTQPKQYIAGGEVKYIPRGYSYQEDEYISNAFEEYSSWEEFSRVTNANFRTIYVSAVIRPRVGFHFVKFICLTYYHGGGVSINGMFSFTTQVMSEGLYRIQITRIGTLSSHPSDVDLQIFAIYEYDGIVNLTVRAIPSNYGTVDVVSSPNDISERNKTSVFVEKLRTLTEGSWTQLGGGPSFDFQVTANDGVVAFKRWSDGGASSHRFTITAKGQTLTAYFSEDRLIFDPNNGSRLIYDPTSKSLMYEHID